MIRITGLDRDGFPPSLVQLRESELRVTQVFAKMFDQFDLDLVAIQAENRQVSVKIERDRAVCPNNSFAREWSTGKGFEDFDSQNISDLHGRRSLKGNVHA